MSDVNESEQHNSSFRLLLIWTMERMTDRMAYRYTHLPLSCLAWVWIPTQIHENFGLKTRYFTGRVIDRCVCHPMDGREMGVHCHHSLVDVNRSHGVTFFPVYLAEHPCCVWSLVSFTKSKRAITGTFAKFQIAAQTNRGHCVIGIAAPSTNDATLQRCAAYEQRRRIVCSGCEM